MKCNSFIGISNLYGSKALELLSQAHFCIVGIGGVGSWAAEALVRTGIGNITLIDMDDICETNINRQLHALDYSIGKKKTQVMADRLHSINRYCGVNCIDNFITPGNANELILPHFDYVIDAIDSTDSKAALVAKCYDNTPIIIAGGAGGKSDPTKIRVDDMGKAIQDPLLAKLRSKLKQLGINRDSKGRLGIECVFSVERPTNSLRDANLISKEISKATTCNNGLGTSMMVTASFGLFAVSHAVKNFINSNT